MSEETFIEGVVTAFKIEGPFDVPYETRKGGRTLLLSEFWKSDRTTSMAGLCGCYVFAVKTPRGCTPIYIGKATKTFKQETFNPANRHKYSDGFSEYAKGRPVMFFVVHPDQRGPRNVNAIGKIEDFLIQAGVVRNPRLQNVRGAQSPRWSIEGVIRSRKRGKRGKQASAFRALFRLSES